MANIFDNYDNLKEQYIPSNMNNKPCPPKPNPFLDPAIPKRPYEDYNAKDAKIVLTEMIDNLLGKLILKGYQTKNISVYIGYSKEKIPSLKYSITYQEATNSYRKLLKNILEEYDKKINKSIPIRRIGLSFNHLEKRKTSQLDIFEKITEEDGANEVSLSYEAWKEQGVRSAPH